MEKVLDKHKGVIKNKYFLFWTRFFVELNALNAVVQLFYLRRGLTNSDILYLGIVYSITALLFEIPTGYIADIIGRKKVIILGVILSIIVNLLMFQASGFWQFALITALYSLSYSCFSGTDDALIYDSLRQTGDTKSLLRISGKYLSAARSSKIITPFIGALIAGSLVNWQFNILIGINALSSFVALIFSTKLVEPNRYVDVSEKEIGIFKDSVVLLRKNPDLTRIIFNKTLVFIVDLILWKVYQPILTGMGISVFMLGVLYLFFQSFLTLIYWYPEYFKNKLGHYNIFKYVPIFMLLLAIYIFFGNQKYLVYIAVTIFFAIATARDPYFTELLQQKLKSYNRATSTSLLNFFKSILDIPLLLISGLLASGNIKNTLLIPIVILTIVVLFVQIKKSDLKKNTNLT